MLEHKHLLVQGKIRTTITEANLTKFLLDLIASIEMDILGGPYIHECVVPHNEGYTAMVAITTSHVVFHSWTSGDFQLDVYSCKSFDVNNVVSNLNRFDSYNLQMKFLNRSTGFIDIII
ncbi:MAG: hypothetical protein RLZZ196_1187 [Bacteroidota bacterium]|jgi:S-adenosylmethionine/arginine decarboxylase-like enzyme